jgi:hypothetical protein
VSGNTATAGGGLFGTGAVTLTNSTVSGNIVTTGNGGGIYGNTTLTATNSTISGNRAGSFGGGFYAETSFNLTNTTVSGNSTNTFGGGLYSNNGGAIASSTITNNIADADNNTTGDGGGIYSNNGTVTILNSIVAGNLRGLLVQDLGSNTAPAGFTNAGNNLIGANNGFAMTFPVSTLVGTIAVPVDPRLALLGNYGGSTQTHALLPGSVALNAGNNAGVPATDQRGATRIVGGTVDIGAFESQGFSLTPLTNTTPQSTLVNTNFGNLLGVQVTENFANSALSVPNILVTFTPSPSGASGLFAGNPNVLTNNLGIAIAPTFTANGQAGSHTVTATATGFNTATFSLTNTPAPTPTPSPTPTPTPSPTPTPKPRDGFGGVYPSGDDIGTGRDHHWKKHHRHRRHVLHLDEEDFDDLRDRRQERRNLRRVLCLKGSIASARTTSIPTCKD